MDAFFRFFTRLVTGFGLFVLLGNRFFGKRINAVVRLTIKAAFRYRLFWVLLARKYSFAPARAAKSTVR